MARIRYKLFALVSTPVRMCISVKQQTVDVTDEERENSCVCLCDLWNKRWCVCDRNLKSDQMNWSAMGWGGLWVRVRFSLHYWRWIPMYCVATSKCWPPLSLLFIFASLLFMSLTHSQLPSSDFFSPPASVASFFFLCCILFTPLDSPPLTLINSSSSGHFSSPCLHPFQPLNSLFFLFLCSQRVWGMIRTYTLSLPVSLSSMWGTVHIRLPCNVQADHKSLQREMVRAGLLTQQNYTYHCPVLFPFYSVPHYFPQIQFHPSTFSSSLVYIISNNFHNPMKDVILNSLMVSHLF